MEMYTRMDYMIRLIHYLEGNATDVQKVKEICFYRDEHRVTDEEGVELVLHYNLHI